MNLDLGEVPEVCEWDFGVNDLLEKDHTPEDGSEAPPAWADLGLMDVSENQEDLGAKCFVPKFLGGKLDSVKKPAILKFQKDYVKYEETCVLGESRHEPVPMRMLISPKVLMVMKLHFNMIEQDDAALTNEVIKNYFHKVLDSEDDLETVSLNLEEDFRNFEWDMEESEVSLRVGKLLSQVNSLQQVYPSYFKRGKLQDDRLESILLAIEKGDAKLASTLRHGIMAKQEEYKADL